MLLESAESHDDNNKGWVLSAVCEKLMTTRDRTKPHLLRLDLDKGCAAHRRFDVEFDLRPATKNRERPMCTEQLQVPAGREAAYPASRARVAARGIQPQALPLTEAVRVRAACDRVAGLEPRHLHAAQWSL